LMLGYKMVVEILVKAKGAHVKEVPYEFTNRRMGASKLDSRVMLDYIRAVRRLNLYGKLMRQKEKRTSVHFLSKAARFYTVGATGLLVNYLASVFFNALVPNPWCLYSTVIGILVSMTSNFFLNRLWTFEEKDFSLKKTAIQYAMFTGFSSLGGAFRLGLVYALVDNYRLDYPIVMILAVAAASVAESFCSTKIDLQGKDMKLNLAYMSYNIVLHCR
jgi:dolichol-phosphate mannosyltransferase